MPRTIAETVQVGALKMMRSCWTPTATRNAHWSKPDREAPLIANVQVLERRQNHAKSVLRAYLGLEVLADLKERLLSLLGLRREGQLMLTDRELVVSSKRTLGGRIFERTGDSHALSDLLAVNVKRRLRLFCSARRVGADSSGLVEHLLFVGLRCHSSLSTQWCVHRARHYLRCGDLISDVMRIP